jgi:hypothetical protein
MTLTHIRPVALHFPPFRVSFCAKPWVLRPSLFRHSRALPSLLGLMTRVLVLGLLSLNCPLQGFTMCPGMSYFICEPLQR